MNKLQAPEGHIFQHRQTGEILGKTIYLGINDSPENYQLIEDVSIDEEEN